MKICQKQGNGVCINCPQIPPKGYGDICIYRAEVLLDCFVEIAKTELTRKQELIFEDFGVEIKEVEE
jgi:hypothetical protein